MKSLQDFAAVHWRNACESAPGLASAPPGHRLPHQTALLLFSSELNSEKNNPTSHSLFTSPTALTGTALPKDAATSLWEVQRAHLQSILLAFLVASGPVDLTPFLQSSLPRASVTSFPFISYGSVLSSALAPFPSLTPWAWVLTTALSQPFPLFSTFSAWEIPCASVTLVAFYVSVTPKSVSSSHVTPLSSRPIYTINFWIFPQADSLSFMNSTLSKESSSLLHRIGTTPISLYIDVCALLALL